MGIGTRHSSKVHLVNSDGINVNPHPPEPDLADYIEGTLNGQDAVAVGVHLVGCFTCRSIVEGTAVGLDESPPRSSTMVMKASIPTELSAALNEQAVLQPEAGQVWRLRARLSPDEELAAIGVVLRVDEDILVAPVTFDTQEATDAWTVQLALGSTEIDIAVWVSLEVMVSWEVLDVVLGSVDPDSLRTVHRALRRGGEPPRGLRLGRALDGELRSYRERLRARFIVLSDARLDGSMWTSTGPSGSTESISVTDAIAQAGWKVGELAKSAGINAKQARLAIEGEYQLTPEQVSRVSTVMGIELSPTPAQFNRKWVRAIGSPVLRPRFSAVARQQDRGEWELRQEAATQHGFAIAARGNDGSEENWSELAIHYLEDLERSADLRD